MVYTIIFLRLPVLPASNIRGDEVSTIRVKSAKSDTRCGSSALLERRRNASATQLIRSTTSTQALNRSSFKGMSPFELEALPSLTRGSMI